MVLSKTCGIFSIAFAYYRVAGTLTSRADIERALVSIKSLKWCALKSDVMFGRWWGKANEVETNPKKGSLNVQLRGIAQVNLDLVFAFCSSIDANALHERTRLCVYCMILPK